MPLALAAIAVSVWHGAFDGVLAESTFQPRYGPSWRPVFYLTYVVLVVVVLILWYTAPVLALALFLLYSGLHFGTEGEQQLSGGRVLTGLATGFVPIAAACHWWPQEVSSIFAVMLGGHSSQASVIALYGGRALWVAVVLTVAGAFAKEWLPISTLVCLATEIVLFRFCSPLVAFAVFFCLWHTPEHVVGTSLDEAGNFRAQILKRNLLRGLAPWLFSLTGVALLGWYGRHTVQTYTGALFIGLSALTVPHMILAELYRRRLVLHPTSRHEIEMS